MSNLSVLDVVSLVAAIVSIIIALGGVALAITFFLSAKKSEQNQAASVLKIDESTKTLSRLSLKMLDRLTAAVISPRPTDEKISEILKSVNAAGTLNPDEDLGLPTTKKELEQMRVDNLITACFYCGATNIMSQGYLPTSIELTTLDLDTANLIDQSKNDFLILKTWLENTPDVNEKIQNSAVAHLYNLILSIEPNVKSIREYYASKESETTA